MAHARCDWSLVDSHDRGPGGHDVRSNDVLVVAQRAGSFSGIYVLPIGAESSNKMDLPMASRREKARHFDV